MVEVRAPLTSRAVSAKLDAALCYRSQLAFQFGSGEALRDRLGNGEGVECFRSRTDTLIPTFGSGT